MALVTAAEARLAIPALTSTGEDSNLDRLIDRAGAFLAAWCGYPPAAAGGVATFEDVTYTMILDGPGGAELVLPVGPLVSVTSVHSDPLREYGSDVLVASGDYTLDSYRSLVILDNDSTQGAWDTGYRAIKIVYVAGFATVPADIKQAAIGMVAHWWRLRRQAGKKSVSQEGGSVSLLEETIPAQVAQLLGPYRLAEVCFG